MAFKVTLTGQLFTSQDANVNKELAFGTGEVVQKCRQRRDGTSGRTAEVEHSTAMRARLQY